MAQKLRTRLVLAAGMCLALLAGCGAQHTDARRVLRVAQYPDPDELNPQQNSGSQVYMGLCEPLTGLGIADAGDIRMRGAESVDTADGLMPIRPLGPQRADRAQALARLPGRGAAGSRRGDPLQEQQNPDQESGAAHSSVGLLPSITQKPTRTPRRCTRDQIGNLCSGQRQRGDHLPLGTPTGPVPPPAPLRCHHRSPGSTS